MREFNLPATDIRPQLAIAPTPDEVQAIPDGAQLVTFEEAQIYLQEQYRIGFSRPTLSKYRRDNVLVEGYHFRKLINGQLRFYLPNLEKAFIAS